MEIAGLLFYVFSGLVILSALGVVLAKNPVHAVLFLIFAFFNAAGLLVLLGAEFLAMLLVIVYVGAVAVLFLFVVMMLNINFAKARESFSKSLPIILFVALMFFADLYIVIKSSNFVPVVEVAVSHITNTETLGLVLYTDYFLPFQLAGVILLIAMIGSILLTLRRREGVRKQKIYMQNMRDPKQTIEIVKVKTGAGVDAIN